MHKFFNNTNINSTTKHISKSTKPSNLACRIVLSTIVAGASLFGATVSALADETTISVDLASTTTTKHEIAVLQVLSEVCPSMLPEKKHSAFYKTYNNELQKLLPTIDDPKAAIQYLSTQQDYKGILKSMRRMTLNYSQEDNLALCNDLANASH